jgi:hypothetical protein
MLEKLLVARLAKCVDIAARAFAAGAKAATAENFRDCSRRDFESKMNYEDS